jgi:hypothetical protein
VRLAVGGQGGVGMRGRSSLCSSSRRRRTAGPGRAPAGGRRSRPGRPCRRARRPAAGSRTRPAARRGLVAAWSTPVPRRSPVPPWPDPHRWRGRRRAAGQLRDEQPGERSPPSRHSVPVIGFRWRCSPGRGWVIDTTGGHHGTGVETAPGVRAGRGRPASGRGAAS